MIGRHGNGSSNMLQTKHILQQFWSFVTSCGAKMAEIPGSHTVN